MKVFEEWKKQRNEAVLKRDYIGEPVIKQDIDEMSDEMLDFTLGRFVAEVRKEDGQEYPGKTLYEILSSIQMYLRVQCKRNITLIDKKGCTFRNLNSALNFVMKERARQGIGVDVNQANLITKEQENYLWEHGFLGSENTLVCDTLRYVGLGSSLGVNFALRAGQEHRNLRLRNSQLSLQCDELGREFLQYTEDISKKKIMGD